MQNQKLKTLTATVMGKSGNNSVKVSIDFKVKHPKYGKYIKRRTKLAVHDEHNQSGVGDLIEIVESRHYSKTKSWRLVRILEKGSQV